MFDSFFQKAPALLFGFALFLGFQTGFGNNLALLPALMIMILASKRVFFTAILFLSAYGFTQLYYQYPEGGSSRGIAHISIAGVSPYQKNFSGGMSYRGVIKAFYSKGKVVGKNIPFHFTEANHFPASQDYLVKGKLTKNSLGKWRFYPKKGHRWDPVPQTWSLAEWRYQTKKKMKKIIAAKIQSHKAAAFLGGIATGLFEDSTLSKELGRFGLQHIMAISGFHFAACALFLSIVLRFFFPEKKAAAAIVVVLTTYFAFLGPSPSILRAWIMAVIYFAGILLQKQSRGLNSLGVAMIASLIFDPSNCERLSFQFSFLVTASILLFYQPMNLLLQKIFPKRPFAEVMVMSLLDRHGYLFSSLLRQSLALMLAVQLVSFPLILFISHKFYLMGLIYNLFYPFLVSISIFLLLLGLLVPFSVIHTLNSAYTDFVLNLTYGLPASFDFLIRCDHFPVLFLTGYLSLLFAVAPYARKWTQERESDLAFL